MIMIWGLIPVELPSGVHGGEDEGNQHHVPNKWGEYWHRGESYSECLGQKEEEEEKFYPRWKLKTFEAWGWVICIMHLKEVYVAVATKIRMYTGLGENFAHPKVRSFSKWLYMIS